MVALYGRLAPLPRCWHTPGWLVMITFMSLDQPIQLVFIENLAHKLGLG